MTHEIQMLMLEYYELWGRMDAVYDRWAKAHGMTYTELMVLYALWETKQPITQRDLCQERHLPKQTVNSVLHALAKRQLVVFRESALDHRRKEILLTPALRALDCEVMHELHAFVIQIIQRVGITSMKTMLTEMRRFLEAFEEAGK